jgi:hypothetical protein
MKTNLTNFLKNHWQLFTFIFLLSLVFLGLNILLNQERRISLTDDYMAEIPVFVSKEIITPENDLSTKLIAEKVNLDRKIITPTAGTTPNQIARLIEAQGGVIISQTSEFVVAEIPSNISTEVESQLVESNLANEYEIDYPVFLSIATRNQYDWGVAKIEAPPVWSTTTGPGINVGIVDTGIDYTHPELSSSYIRGFNAITDSDNPFDDHGHGTHVAGIVAAELNNSSVAGVSPQANLYGIKVLSGDGTGYISDLVKGVDWAINQRLQILNFSLGTTYDSKVLQNKLKEAHNSGIILVAASGNTSGGSLLYPAAYTEVIAVGATDANDNLASFSSLGSEFVAPGVGIRSTVPGGGYATWSGTSMSSPHLAGTIALMLANEQTNVRELLRNTAIDLGPAGKDNYFGYGLIHAEFATLGMDVLAPIVTFLEPEHQSTINGMVAVKLDIQDESEIIKAELFVNNVVLSEWTEEPFEMIWDTTQLPAGEYTLLASAVDEYDNIGNAQIIVTVDQDFVPTPTPSPTPTPDTLRRDDVSFEFRQDIHQEQAVQQRRDQDSVPTTTPTPQSPPDVSNIQQRNPRPSNPGQSVNQDGSVLPKSQVDDSSTPGVNVGPTRGVVRGAMSSSSSIDNIYLWFRSILGF